MPEEHRCLPKKKDAERKRKERSAFTKEQKDKEAERKRKARAARGASTEAVTLGASVLSALEVETSVPDQSVRAKKRLRPVASRKTTSAQDGHRGSTLDQPQSQTLAKPTPVRVACGAERRRRVP